MSGSILNLNLKNADCDFDQINVSVLNDCNLSASFIQDTTLDEHFELTSVSMTNLQDKLLIDNEKKFRSLGIPNIRSRFLIRALEYGKNET